MTPERWLQVERLYHSALEREGDDRAVFLDQACGGDDALRKEVESLLAQDIGGEGLLDRSALGAMAAEMFDQQDGRSLVGSQLGSYRVLSLLGRGGMGEVYRARDTKLGRDVAIKVLPNAFARDAARMARFRREARLLASLNHPNIASIYGFEESDSTHALVMELVEGPTLADRIHQGPIPLDESLPIAKQMAEALEYAHERGIIHRDLKPTNVKQTSEGAVKVLDFGLAKALETELSAEEIANSPTISQMATEAGVLLGTAAYMSPEQAKAKAVDRRADIWAFGCVLYEMLTGRRPFRGETVTDTLAAVLKNEPDWSHLPTTTPNRIRVLLSRCLQKDPKQRLQAMGDVRIALQEVLSGTPESAPLLGATVPAWRRATPWVIGLLAVAVASFVVWNLKPPPTPRQVTRFTITLPPGQRLAGLDYPALALSADANQLAYVATTSGGPQQIYLRAMDSGEARPIPGTEGATTPFFSPDGLWLGFFADKKLKKIPVNGGVAQTLGDAPEPLGASWGSAGTIAFSSFALDLQQVSDKGGAPQPLTRAEVGETTFQWPEFLPGSKAVVFDAGVPYKIDVQLIGAGERRHLFQGQVLTMPRYAPSGHLIYPEAGNLMAVPFDLERLRVKGAAAPVLQGVLQSTLNGSAQYSISATGSLVYVSGDVQLSQSRLVWVSRNGTEQPLAAPARSYNQPRLSPDGRRVAVDVLENLGSMQVWLYDLARDTFARFTFEGVNRHPVWTPDGRRIVFMSDREGPIQLYWQLADGSGGLERLTNPATGIPLPYSWSPDGHLLTFAKVGVTTGTEFWVLQVGDSSAGSGQGHKEERFFQIRTADDGAPQLSPDGHWVAYASQETGRHEIYAQAFPGPGGKWQISTDGGNEPQWNHNGRELFYRSGDKMMAVDIRTQPIFTAGKPRQLFEGHYLRTLSWWVRANYDVSPDGQRFLMLKPVEEEQTAPTQINVVLNWTEELKRLVPSEKK